MLTPHYLSKITYHVPCVTYHVSHFTCHMSCVKKKMLYIYFFKYLRELVENLLSTGLPHLVKRDIRNPKILFQSFDVLFFHLTLHEMSKLQFYCKTFTKRLRNKKRSPKHICKTKDQVCSKHRHVKFAALPGHLGKQFMIR